MPQGLPSKIRYAFVMQGLLACLAVVFGVSAVTVVTRDAILRQRLALEGDAFWERHASDGAAARLPGNAAIHGYFSEAGEPLPAYLLSLPEGISYLYLAQRSVLVQKRDGGTLYMVAETDRLDRLMTSSALAMIVLGLLSVLLITRLTYRKSRDIVLPINRLAEGVARWDPGLVDGNVPFPDVDESGREVRALSSALRGLAGRISDFVEREREFTRDASHELRTPLTVIRVASDMMLADPSMPAHAQRPLQRIQRAGRDMEEVIDAFLILAREGGVAPVSEEFDVREAVLEEVEKARPLLGGKPIELQVHGDVSPRLFAPPGVLGVVIGSLVRNACSFTEAGRVDVMLEHDAVIVRDTGIGMSSETLRHAFEPFYRADAFSPLGKGLGLSIASRLARRFGWQLSLDSAPGKGTTAVLRFAPMKPA